MLPAVTVQCPNPDCPARGEQRRVMLRQPTPGVVESPGLLCVRCSWAMEKVSGWPTNQENEMPKITRHGGPSNQFTATWEEHPGTGQPPEQVPSGEELTGDGSGEPLPEVDPAADAADSGPATSAEPAQPEGSEEPSDGSSSSTSSEKPSTEPEPKPASRRSPARTTGSRSKKAQTGSRSASSTGGGRTGGTSGTSSDN